MPTKILIAVVFTIFKKIKKPNVYPLMNRPSAA
jgi:hypothetical protein